MSVLVATARACERGEHVSGIRVNVGGKIAAHASVDYLSRLLDAGPKVKTVKAHAKVVPWDASIWPLVEKHKDCCRPSIRTPEQGRLNTPVLHVRVGDRSPVSVETYRRFVERHEGALTILGNDPGLVRDLAGQTHHAACTDDPVEDWFLLRRAERVIAPRSYFTLSAAVLDPKLHVEYFPDHDGTVRFWPDGLRTFNRGVKFLPNTSFLHELAR